MAIRNPFDQIILDDPAYAEETRIDPQAGKKLVRDIYGLVVGEEDPYSKDKLNRELSVALAQREAGLPVDPNKSFVTSAERQDPALGPALNKFGYKPMGLGEFGEKTLEFLYRDQEKARSKELRGEELTFGEKIAANPFMAALDAADFTGLIGLATKGGIKLSAKGLQTLTNLKNQGASKEVINQVMTKQFPDDAQKIGLVYYQNNKPPGMETSQVLNKADDGSGSGPGLSQQTIRGNEQKQKIDDLVLDYIQKNPGGTPQDMMKATGLTEAQKQKSILRLKQSNPEILEKNLIMGKPEGVRGDIRKALEGMDFKTSMSYKELSERIPNASQAQISNFFNQPLSQIPGDEAAKYTYKDLYPNIYGFGTKDFGDGKGVVRIKDGILNALKKVPEGEMIQIDDFSKKLGVSYNAVREAAGTDPKLLDKIEFRRILDPDNIDETDSIKKAEKVYTNVLDERLGQGPGGRETSLFFDGFLRSSSPESFGFTRKDFIKKSKDGRNIFDKEAWFNWRMNRFVDDFGPNWKSKFDEELKYINGIEGARNKANDEIAQFLADKKKQYPNLLKDLNYTDYKLQIAHNFPLAKTSKRDEFVDTGMMKGSSRLGYAATNLKHHQRLESILYSTLGQIDFLKQNNKIPEGQIPQSANKLLAYVDKEANKLGTVIYYKIDDKVYKAGREESPSPEALVQSFKNHINVIIGQNKGKDSYNPKKFKDKKFGERKVIVTGKSTGKVDVPEEQENVLYKKGGAVRKAIGGTLENINQQNFTPDPAIEGDSAFQQAVKDENLVAFNPTKIFKFFKDKIPGVYTPSKTDVPPPARDPNTNQANLPTVEGLKDYDFALKSFTVDKIQNSNTKAAKPQDWINELQGGNASPSAELQDSGLFQYMADFERYYPNSRMTKEQLINFYEQSPIANLQVKVKAGPTETPYGMADQEFMGRPQHQNAGSAPLDNVGTNYREIVISAGKLPGEDTPFIASSHFNDPNVLVFSRVADYKNAGGDNVTVIQELQTDLLTNVRKEQERLAAEILNQKNKLQANQERLQRATENGDIYTKNQAQQNIDSIQKTLPQIEKLAETGLIKPYPLTVAQELIPTFEKQMMDFQSEMQDLMRAGINRTDPEYLMKIDDLQKKQFAVFEELRNLNRTSKFDDLTDGVKVPQSSDTENLQLYAQNQSSYESTKDVTTFPPIPFNKQADYVDLILKATIKDAENRNINKIAIMPAEVGANNRWNKTGDAKKKFENLYDKVGVQQLKNIAKKYGGELNVEKIQDTSKGTFGVKYFNKGVDGKDVFGETDGLDIRDAESYAAYFDSRAMQEIANYGDGKVMVRREIAPGQFSEFILKSDNPDTSKGYKLVDPTGDEAVIRVMEEYNPSLVDMMVLTLPKAEGATKTGPMFMFRKKEGGIIPEDRLVSITDIYGDY